MNTKKVIFFGTPDFAVPPLHALIQSKRNVVLTVTQPDRQAGRGQKLSSPPVKKFCDEQHIPCIQPISIKTNEFLGKVKEVSPDLIVVAAYGKIFPKALLNAAPFVLNIHASLLPRWRGASPISQAILHGDPTTGISIMQLVEKLDAGPVMLRREIKIEDEDDVRTLSEKLATLGASSLIEALDLIDTHQHQFEPQDEEQVVFAPLQTIQDAKINWKHSVKNVFQHIRAFAPEPGAHTFDGKERIKIFRTMLTGEKTDQTPGTIHREKKKLKIACNDEWLNLIELQRQGKTRQTTVDFLNGYPMDRTQWE